MHNAHAVRGSTEERPALAGGPVERSRALAAPGDQNVQDAAGRPWRDAEEFFTDGEARGFGLAGGKMGSRFGEGNESARDEAADDAVGETGHGIGLHHHHRDASHQRRHYRRSGHVTAHAEDRGGLADEFAASEGGEGQPQ